MSRQDMGVTSDDLPRMSRRAVLGGALSLGALSVVLAACGDDDDAEAGSDTLAPGDTQVAGDTTVTTGVVSVDPALTVIQGNAEYVPGEQRVALAVLRNRSDGSLETLEGAEVLVGFSLIDPDTGVSEEPAAFVPMTYHAEGLPATKAYYMTIADFTEAGSWEAYVQAGDARATAGLNVVDPAASPLPLTPAVGDAAPRTPTPTTTDTLDVDPICTRTDDAGNVSPCPLHTVSLADAIGSGPVVVTFSTPARCTSQVCGPTLELLLAEADAAPEITFVHVEIYQSNSTNDLLTAIDSSLPDTWSLSSEPWLFAIDADGTVQAKLEGVFDAAEIRDLVATVAPA